MSDKSTVITVGILRGVPVSTKASCGTCQHCVQGSVQASAQGSSQGNAASVGWCRLRSISVHPELAQFAVCHHWTHQAPRLPRLDENSTRPPMDRQLELGRSLVGSVAGDL